MAAIWSRGPLHFLLLLNLLMFATVIGLAGCSFEKYLQRDIHRRLRANTLAVYLVIFSLITGVMGVCSVLAGLVHVRAWRGDSLAAAISSSLSSWAVTTIAFGLACKQINSGTRGARMRALEAFIIILTITQLIYLMLLHMGIVSSRYGVGYRTHCSAYGMMEHDTHKDSAGTAAAREDTLV